MILRFITWLFLKAWSRSKGFAYVIYKKPDDPQVQVIGASGNNFYANLPGTIEVLTQAVENVDFVFQKNLGEALKHKVTITTPVPSKNQGYRAVTYCEHPTILFEYDKLRDLIAALDKYDVECHVPPE